MNTSGCILLYEIYILTLHLRSYVHIFNTSWTALDSDEKSVHMQDKDTRFACKHFICMLSEKLLLIQCCYMRSF